MYYTAVTLGRAARTVGDFEAAEAYLQEAKRYIPGPPYSTSLHLVRVHNALGVLYFQWQRWEDAERILRQGLAIEPRHLQAGGEPLFMKTQGMNWLTLGQLHMSRGEFPEAREAYAKALALQEQVLPEDHTDRAATKMNVAFVLQQQGRCDEAMVLLEEVLGVLRRTWAVGDLYLQQCLYAMANCHLNLGNLREAEECLLEAVETLEREDQVLDPLAYCLRRLGEVYVADGRDSEAEECFTQSAEVFVQTARLPSTDAANTLLMTIPILRRREASITVAERYREISDLFLDVPGEESKAIRCLREGAAFMAEDEPEEAEIMLLDAVDLARDSVGFEHAEVREAVRQLVRTYKDSERHDEAAKFEALLQSPQSND